MHPLRASCVSDQRKTFCYIRRARRFPRRSTRPPSTIVGISAVRTTDISFDLFQDICATRQVAKEKRTETRETSAPAHWNPAPFRPTAPGDKHRVGVPLVGRRALRATKPGRFIYCQFIKGRGLNVIECDEFIWADNCSPSPFIRSVCVCVCESVRVCVFATGGAAEQTGNNWAERGRSRRLFE